MKLLETFRNFFLIHVAKKSTAPFRYIITMYSNYIAEGSCTYCNDYMGCNVKYDLSSTLFLIPALFESVLLSSVAVLLSSVAKQCSSVAKQCC